MSQEADNETLSKFAAGYETVLLTLDVAIRRTKHKPVPSCCVDIGPGKQSYAQQTSGIHGKPASNKCTWPAGRR